MAIEISFVGRSAPNPLLGEVTENHAHPMLETGAPSHETQNVYFAWLDARTEEEVFPLFGTEYHELRALSPVAPSVNDSITLHQTVERPAEDQLVKESSLEFDPDVFLTEYLDSPEGKAILDDVDAIDLESDAPELFQELSTIPLEMQDQYGVGYAPLTTVDFVQMDFTSTEAYADDSRGSCVSSPYATDDSQSACPSVEDYDVTDSSGDDEDPAWLPSSSSSSVISSTSVRKANAGVTGAGKKSSIPRRRHGPRQKRSPQEKRERKKGQNRTAALRYRQKKREEFERIQKILTDEKTRNVQLRARVDTVKEDIKYFKSLMITVLEAKLGGKSA